MSRLARLAGRILATVPRRPRHKLHAVRYRRLSRSVREVVALCDDAADKLGGEWILDRSYVTAFGQRAVELARSIVFDGRVLSGDESGRLFASLDAARGQVEGRLARGPAPDDPPADGSPDEPEYRLLRQVLESVRIREEMAASRPSPTSGETRLADVVADAHEQAVRSFERLPFNTWGRRTGRPLEGSGFPGSIRVVDAGGGRAASRTGGWRRRVRWVDLHCAPLRALLEPLSPPGASGSGNPRRPWALAVVSEEHATLEVGWPERRLLLDACLGDHAEANLVYVVLRGAPTPSTSVLEDVAVSGGFRVVPLAPGLTAWLAGRGPGDTRRALGRLGTSLAALGGGPATQDSPHRGLEAGRKPVGTLNGRGRA